jgi:hypothetical protein
MELLPAISVFLLGWTAAMTFMYGLKKYLDWRDAREGE